MIIGVDVGGTKVEAVRVDDEYRVLDRHRLPSEMHAGVDAVLANMFSAVRAVWSDQVRGIGISLPGYLEDGVVVFGPNTQPLVGVNLVDRFQREFNVPCAVENDANCFALAEYRLGAGKGSTLCVGVIIGTGVGGGFVINGKLLQGVSDSAAEIGHLYDVEGRDFESRIAGPAIVRQYMELGGSAPRPHPSQIWASDEEAAVKTRDAVVRATGVFFANVINAMNPDVLVVGGGVSNLPYYDAVRAVAEEFCVPRAFAACKIVQHSLGDSAGVLGAAMLLEQ